jgi:outer membrane usher protein
MVICALAAALATRMSIADNDGARRPAPTNAAPVTLYLEVTVNGQATHSIVSFKKQSGRLYVGAKDLEGLGANLSQGGIVPPHSASHGLDGPSENDAQVELGSVSGLTYRLDEPHQSIELNLSDALRAPYVLGRTGRGAPVASSGTGFVFNYDVVAQGAPSTTHASSFDMSTEQRYFGPLGVFSNTGILVDEDDSHRYVRQSTTYQYDAPHLTSTLLAGDVVSSSLSWTRAVRLGGFELSRDFALHPDLVTFPVPQFGGSAAVPSTVDLYVNNVRQLTSDVPGGPFVINGAANITGGGLATVVIRDPMGHAVTASLPIYIDSRMLAQGLSSYSIEGGLLRYNYGERSFDYEGHAALSGTYRYGYNEAVTLETHVEGTPDFFDAGFGGLWRMGTRGVLSLSAAGSTISSRERLTVDSAAPDGTYQLVAPLTGDTLLTTSKTLAGYTGSGGQAALGYQLILPLLSITAQAVHAFGHYADLAAVGGTPVPRTLEQITASLPLTHDRTLGASFVHVDDMTVGKSSIASVWSSQRISHAVSVEMSVSRDLDQAKSLSAQIGVSIDFGNRLTGFTDVGVNGGQLQYGASMSQNADYGGGWEWMAQTNHTTQGENSLVRGGYLGRYGEVTASVDDYSGYPYVTLEAIGGVLFMDEAVEASRRIANGFALVSTDGLAGVPVLHENRELGVTDAGGHLLVPDLTPWVRNNLSIDTLNLPAADQVPVGHMDVTPRGLSGVLVHFPIQHYSAATMTLVDGVGNYLPAGTPIRHVETGKDLTVGYDGIVFIEDLGPRNHLQVRTSTVNCNAEVEFDTTAFAGGALPHLGRILCGGDAGTHP